MKENGNEMRTWTRGIVRGRGLNWSVSSLVESVGNSDADIDDDDDDDDVFWRKSTEIKKNINNTNKMWIWIE
jgi:hypothetical protein